MFFVKLLNNLGNLLIRSYYHEANRLHDLAIAESNSSRRIANSSDEHLEAAAKLAAMAQRLDKIINDPNENVK